MGKILMVLVLSLVAGSADAELFSRLEGNAYYDDELDITWATNSHIFGQIKLAPQQVAIAGLIIEGVGDWRLPTMGPDFVTPVNCATSSEADCKTNEMGYHFEHNLISQTNQGVFVAFGILSGYWSSTALSAEFQATFNFNTGTNSGNNGILPGWAVHDGDVEAIPEPGTALLLGTGLGALAIGRRRKRV